MKVTLEHSDICRAIQLFLKERGQTVSDDVGNFHFRQAEVVDDGLEVVVRGVDFAAPGLPSRTATPAPARRPAPPPQPVRPPPGRIPARPHTVKPGPVPLQYPPAPPGEVDRFNPGPPPPTMAAPLKHRVLDVEVLQDPQFRMAIQNANIPGGISEIVTGPKPSRFGRPAEPDEIDRMPAPASPVVGDSDLSLEERELVQRYRDQTASPPEEVLETPDPADALGEEPGDVELGDELPPGTIVHKGARTQYDG